MSARSFKAPQSPVYYGALRVGTTASGRARLAAIGLGRREREQPMPQDNSRNDSQRSEDSRNDSTRSERWRSDKMAAANLPSGETAARSVASGLRVQTEMLGLFSEIGQEWFARATSEAELAFDLPNKLTAARSVPDAISAYREWFGEWMSMCGEDSRRLISDGQRIVETGVRCFAGTTPTATS
jgi:hypothetical protein